MASTHTRLTVMVDNNALEPDNTAQATSPQLAAEHGWAVWIESGGQKILFDTGQGPSLQANAPALGVDLTEADAVVLSHGHYDHTGGLPYALQCASASCVYCHPSVLQIRYAVDSGEARSIGMPDASREVFDRLPDDRMRWVIAPTMLTPEIGLTGPIPRLTTYEDTGGPFYLDSRGWRPDPLEDDLALWISTKEGLVVCLGCAHAGVINTLDYVGRLNPNTRLRAVIGGLHLMNAGGERLQQTARALLAEDIPLILASHCTGAAAVQLLSDTLGERSRPCAAGMVLEF